MKYSKFLITSLILALCTFSSKTLQAEPARSVIFFEHAIDKFRYCIANDCVKSVTSTDYSRLDILYIVSTPAADNSNEVGDVHYNTYNTSDEVVDICYANNTYCLNVEKSFFGYQVTYFLWDHINPSPTPPRDKPGEGPDEADDE